ncbi:oligopeptide/dipeptide ABC transporter ATP-binding protein, partial [Streptomyces sp. NPDC005373]
DPVTQRTRERIVLSGELPSPLAPPPGCRFHTRCPLAVDRCRTEVPALRTLDSGREVSCHLVADDGTAPDAAAPRPVDADTSVRTIPHSRPASA